MHVCKRFIFIFIFIKTHFNVYFYIFFLTFVTTLSCTTSRHVEMLRSCRTTCCRARFLYNRFTRNPGKRSFGFKPSAFSPPCVGFGEFWRSGWVLCAVCLSPNSLSQRCRGRGRHAPFAGKWPRVDIIYVELRHSPANKNKTFLFRYRYSPTTLRACVVSEL